MDDLTAWDEETYRRQCEGKVPYRRRVLANKAMNRVILNSHGSPASRGMNVYHCPHCGRWHFGHRSRSKT